MICELCNTSGGDVVFEDDKLRVVLVNDALYPGFCRVISQQHVAEMSDLPAEQRAQMMQAVWQTEQVVRDTMQADKINLASLGNMTPHVHWHVIPRFKDDPHFPQPIWGQQQREPGSQHPARQQKLPQLAAALRQALQELHKEAA